MDTIDRVDVAPNLVDVELIRYGLIHAADAMKITLMRSSYNPIIYEVLDFSVALFDPEFGVMAQAAGLTIFLGGLGAAVRTVVEDTGRENLCPGDLYLINDPFTAGNHLNDMTAITPIFVGGEGERSQLVGFTAARAHWLDVGGRDPGGWSTDTNEVYQEGIRLRSIPLYRAGELDEAVMTILRLNVRQATSVLGDLRAQIAACRTGEERVREIVERYGAATFRSGVEEMYRQSAEEARAWVRQVPDGTYAAEAILDNDGITDDPLPVKVTVRVAGDRMEIDLTGSSAQCAGPMNCGRPVGEAACRIAFKCLCNPDAPVDEGSFAPLRITIPEGSMFAAQLPAATNLYGISSDTVCDCVFRALAPVLVDSCPAAHYADVCAVFLYGTDPRSGRTFIHAEPEGGGWGAHRGGDGESVLIELGDGDTRNVPVEIIEHRYPLRIERYEMRTDSGGAGEWRGGLGHYRDYRILGDDIRLTTSQERSKCPPWGLNGGHAGAYNTVIVNPDGPEPVRIQKTSAYPLRCGDVVSIRTGGGGGYGDPRRRAPELVEEDVRRGFIGEEAARNIYGMWKSRLLSTKC